VTSSTRDHAWAALCGAVGLLLIGADLRALFADRAIARRWTETEARVVKSEVRIEPDRENGPSHFPEIEYSYTVGGQAFTGRCCTEGGPRAKVQQLVDETPAGTQVTVYVDPAFPGQSRLRSSLVSWTGRSSILLLVGGAVFLGAGISMLVSARRRALAARPSGEPMGGPIAHG
jgi:hypothetical protein